MNELVLSLTQNDHTEYFFQQQHIAIHNLVKEHCPNILQGGTETKGSCWTGFYGGFHTYANSAKFKGFTNQLFNTNVEKETSVLKKMAAVRMLSLIREEVLAYYSSQSVEAHILEACSKKIPDPNLVDAARGKIRYIGGRTIAKLVFMFIDVCKNCSVIDWNSNFAFEFWMAGNKRSVLPYFVKGSVSISFSLMQRV